MSIIRAESTRWLVGFTLLVLLGIPHRLFGQETDLIAEAQKPQLYNTGALSIDANPYRVLTIRRQGDIAIDGIQAEQDWALAPVISDFTQSEPNQGQAPTEKTEVRIMYDDQALYISARLYDSSPDSILARLGRRDVDVEADHFVAFLDPFFDRRSGYYFGINAAGILYDGVMMNDDWDDSSWDGVWEGKASIDDEGWTVEMRIPFSQLRFYQRDQYVWGINFRRGIARKNEMDYLVYTPRNESGFVSRFRELTGIKGVVPHRQVEIRPYVIARAEFTDQPTGNPFDDGSTMTPDIGADMKFGLTSNLTLNATVNPDFGQVEVDPAVVNLSDIETFFPEQRPFFVEGSSVFNGYGRGGASSNWSFNWGNPNFFYSRRIGRAPQGSLPENDFASYGDGARILGAAKLSGRLGSGWNVGLIQAVTGREVARLTTNGVQSRSEMEPVTYYGVVRGQREFNGGRQALGMIATNTSRSFNGDRLRSELNGGAQTIGIDGWTFLDAERTWVMTAWLGMSRVSGSPERITALQQSALHYFQRPDAGHVRLDSTATQLVGSSGRLMLNKQRGRIGVNAAIGYVSPGFDPNDLGFFWRSDVINAHIGGQIKWMEPGSWYRWFVQNAAVFASQDFDGNTTWAGIWLGSFMQFSNYYELTVRVAANPQTKNNRLTRGGPLKLNTPGVEAGVEFKSDGRKSWVFGLNFNSYFQREGSNLNIGPEVRWNPASNVSLSVSPSISLGREFSQWVGAYDDPYATDTYGRRYVFAELDQKTISSSIRLNWTFTPLLSLQLFAQPLLSAGSYETYKELARPDSYNFNNFGDGASTFDPDRMVADPDGEGPASEINLGSRDFNFKSLRGTAVLRWEFRPGSTLFLVWTQTRSHTEEDGTFRFSQDVRTLFNEKPDNIFMLKVTYWFSR